MHLKDYKIEFDKEKNSFTPNFAPLGEGTLDFEKIIAKMQTLGVEYYLVEQDNAALLPNTLEEVEKSIKYLQTM